MEYTANMSSQSLNGELPTYMIYRDVRPGEPFDPSAPLHFLPPKDSDELFDALRFAFPHLKTHSERLRDATIKFLLDEQRSYTPSPAPAGPATTQPATQTFAVSPTSTASGSSNTLNIWNHATISTRGKFKHVPSSSHQSTQSSSLLTKDMPPQEDMTGVFSISSVQPKQHSRRRMTEREKAEYRQRRMAKACDKCARRKRKCIHNLAGSISPQPEHEGSRQSSSKATSDISSPTSIDSRDQGQGESSQETASMTQRLLNEGMRFDYSGDQLMLGIPPLPDVNLSNWYMGTNPGVVTSPIDPYLESALLGAMPRGLETTVQDWPEDQLMEDWPTEAPSEMRIPRMLRMGEFLQFDDMVPEQWQFRRSQGPVRTRVACSVSPHGEEEYVLPEDNEWCINRRLLAGKQTIALQDTLAASRLRRGQDWTAEGNATYNHDDGHHSSPSCYRQPRQTPGKDSKMAVDYTGHYGGPFDAQEMTVPGGTAVAAHWRRYEVFKWVFEAMLKNATLFGAVLTLMTPLLRQEEKKVVVLHGFPILEVPRDVDETEEKKDLPLYQP